MDTLHDTFAPLPPGGETIRTPEKGANAQPDKAVILPAPLPLPEVIRHRAHGTPARLWRYLDADGRLLFVVARFDKPGGGKEVLPYCCTASAWTWKGPPAPRPLYGLHALAQRPEAPVVLVEGEKAADAAASLFPGHVAMTWQGGSNATGKADLAPLAGRTVTIWPDNDDAGRRCAAELVPLLHAAGAASVALVTVPETWPEGWDVADTLPDGVTAETLATMLAEAVPQPLADDDADAEAEAGEPMTPEEREAAIAAYAALPQAERAAQRRETAHRLGMTVNDLNRVVKALRARWLAEAQARARARAEPGPGEVLWPPGYSLKSDGLYADMGDDNPPAWLASPFEVLGEARDAANNGWSLHLRWRDRDGVPHLWPVPKRLLVAETGALEAELVSRGLGISVDHNDRASLRRALGGVRAGSRVRLAHRAGWQSGGVFLLPDGEVIGTSASGEAVVLDNPPEDAARLCASAGTLAGWQAEVAALAVGNPLAAFCMAAAFAAPLLHLLGEPGGGFHLSGSSKRGKTAAARMGLSAWARPFEDAALRKWNATANAFEGVAEAHGDMPLVLDELHQANPAEVARAVYMLADGAGKDRLNRDASARRRRNWRCFILSAGEHDLAVAVAKAGQKLPAGADVRLPSLLVPDAAEGWPALHGRASLQALWDDLHRAMQAQHGTAARAFLAALVAADLAEVRRVVQALRERLAALLPAGADPQVREVARRFGLVAAAGTLASAWGVLPWPEAEAETAAATMLRGWLARRPGGAGSAEVAAQLERVRLFLSLHGASRFTVLVEGADNPGRPNGRWVEAHPDRPVANRAGWRKPRADAPRDEYLILPEVWNTDVCGPAGLDPVATAKALAIAGGLRRGSDRLTVKERVPGLENPAWVYAVSAALLEAPAEDGAP